MPTPSMDPMASTGRTSVRQARGRRARPGLQVPRCFPVSRPHGAAPIAKWRKSDPTLVVEVGRGDGARGVEFGRAPSTLIHAPPTGIQLSAHVAVLLYSVRPGDGDHDRRGRRPTPGADHGYQYLFSVMRVLLSASAGADPRRHLRWGGEAVLGQDMLDVPCLNVGNARSRTTCLEHVY
jgi:hypothetical protein